MVTLPIHLLMVSVMLVAAASPAEEVRYHVFKVTATNGTTMEFNLMGTADDPTASDKIWYQFISSNGPAFRIYLPKPAYLCTVELTGPDGKPVAKTSVGKRYGTAFDQAKGPDTPIDVDKGGSWVGSIVTPYGSGQFRLPPCDELFEVKRPGNYTFKVQFQVIREIIRDGKYLGKELVRFPPIEIRVRME